MKTEERPDLDGNGKLDVFGCGCERVVKAEVDGSAIEPALNLVLEATGSSPKRSLTHVLQPVPGVERNAHTSVCACKYQQSVMSYHQSHVRACTGSCRPVLHAAMQVSLTERK